MEPLKLMIVEDDAFILSDLSTIVDWPAQGFEVVTASNGRQGLHKFEHEKKLEKSAGFCPERSAARVRHEHDRSGRAR